VTGKKGGKCYVTLKCRWPCFGKKQVESRRFHVTNTIT
jgi:hypothetical protein